MTRASAARNARRRGPSIQDQLNAAYNKGRYDLATSLLTPEGFTMPDGRVARIVYEPAPVDGTTSERDEMQQFGTPGEDH